MERQVWSTVGGTQVFRLGGLVAFPSRRPHIGVSESLDANKVAKCRVI